MAAVSEETILLSLEPGEVREVDGLVYICTLEGRHFVINAEDYQALQADSGELEN